MGKSKSRKTKSRSTPSGVSVIKSTDELECPKASSYENTINSLLDQLQVPDADENLCALRRLAELFFNEDKTVANDPNQCINRDLQKRFIRSVSPFLVDSRSDIRNAAAGALRNVSVAGGPDICDTMVADDILTPLITLIQKYASDSNLINQCASSTDEHNAVEKENLDTLIQAVHLMWNLCESNETAVKYFNSSNLLCILLKFMDPSVGGIDLAVVVAQCLHTVSDDNENVLSTLKKFEDEIIKLIMTENDEPLYLHLKVLAAGLLVNIHGSLPVHCVHSVFGVLSKVVKIDSRNEFCKLSSEIPLETEALLSSDAVAKLELLDTVVDTQITAFEILTNICSGEEEDNMDYESSGESEDDEQLELNNSNGCTALSEPFLTINSNVHEALAKQDLIQHSYSKTNLPVNVSDILNTHTDTKHIVKKFQKLRCRAFHFLNNLITVLDVEELGSPDDLFKMWTDIGSMIANGESDVDVIESSTAALRAVLMKLVSVQYPKLCQMTPSDLEVIFTIVQRCTANSVCANVTRVVGALGIFCAKNNLDILLTGIGRFLLSIAEKPGPLWVVSEALDTLMDVFAEDNTDSIAYEISLVPHLSAILPIFKRKVRAERKSLGDHYALVTTANSNLARFIVYKKDRLKCFQNNCS